jgi:regulatory protein
MNQQQKTAYEKATILCSRSEKCVFDVEEKLKLWGLPVDECQAVIKKLIDEKYLDNERFARAYVKDKFRFNHWGRQKIEYMLRTKRISSEILEHAFDEIESSDYSENLMKLIKDKALSIKAKDQYDKRSKLMRFAMSRGFESAKIFEALKKLGI